MEVQKNEEIANAVTHAVGAILAVTACAWLVVFASLQGSAWHVVGFAIFGSALVLLYTMSTLYHSLTSPKQKQLFRKFDHMSILLLIAGTYTPFCLTVLNGWLGWTLLGTVWFCAFLGIVLKAFYTGKREILSTVLYVVMGWIIIPVIKPMYEHLPATSFFFLVGGGVLYTVGVFFFLRANVKYSHSVWHLFVMGGSAFHFFSVMALL